MCIYPMEQVQYHIDREYRWSGYVILSFLLLLTWIILQLFSGSVGLSQVLTIVSCIFLLIFCRACKHYHTCIAHSIAQKWNLTIEYK